MTADLLSTGEQRIASCFCFDCWWLAYVHQIDIDWKSINLIKINFDLNNVRRPDTIVLALKSMTNRSPPVMILRLDDEAIAHFRFVLNWTNVPKSSRQVTGQVTSSIVHVRPYGMCQSMSPNRMILVCPRRSLAHVFSPIDNVSRECFQLKAIRPLSQLDRSVCSPSFVWWTVREEKVIENVLFSSARAICTFIRSLIRRLNRGTSCVCAIVMFSWPRNHGNERIIISLRPLFSKKERQRDDGNIFDHLNIKSMCRQACSQDVE